MSTARIYNELAHLWPLISPPQDYAAQADQLMALLGDSQHILELGCGAGHTLCHFDTEKFNLTGIDYSNAMIQHSRKLNPNVTHHVDDMRSARLDRTFDAVIAHDALEYMVTQDDLNRALATAAKHLKPGGLFIAAVSDTEETFVEHDCAADSHQINDMQITNISYVRHHPSGNGIELVMVLLIHQADQLRIERDIHHCGLFSETIWQQRLNENGFEVKSQIADDSGVWFVAHKSQ
jgi:predicted TPR repeat methyltransferase